MRREAYGMSEERCGDKEYYKIRLLPKGTILFRHNLHYDCSKPITLIADFTGDLHSSDYFMSPTFDITFYLSPPRPGGFATYAIYIANYDIKLLEFGTGVSNDDIERTYRDYLTKYNDIGGYVITCDEVDCMGHELVIHPLHFRRNMVVRMHARLYNGDHIVDYGIRNLARYNYFPFLYFTNTGIYNYADLTSDKLLRNLCDVTAYYRICGEARVMNNLLSTTGHAVNGTCYYMVADLRTGYYIITDQDAATELPASPNAYGKFRFVDGANNSITVPVTYPLADKQKLMKIMTLGDHINEDFVEKHLNTMNMSLANHYVLSKGDRNTYIHRFRIENVISRDDIVPAPWRPKKGTNLPLPRMHGGT
jgi:hypothetical protein